MTNLTPDDKLCLLAGSRRYETRHQRAVALTLAMLAHTPSPDGREGLVDVSIDLTAVNARAMADLPDLDRYMCADILIHLERTGYLERLGPSRGEFTPVHLRPDALPPRHDRHLDTSPAWSIAHLLNTSGSQQQAESDVYGYGEMERIEMAKSRRSVYENLRDSSMRVARNWANERDNPARPNDPVWRGIVLRQLAHSVQDARKSNHNALAARRVERMKL